MAMSTAKTSQRARLKRPRTSAGWMAIRCPSLLSDPRTASLLIAPPRSIAGLFLALWRLALDVLALQAVDVGRHLAHLGLAELRPPGRHPLVRPAAADRAQDVLGLAAVDPVVVGEVGPHLAGGVRGVARRAG